MTKTALYVRFFVFMLIVFYFVELIYRLDFCLIYGLVSSANFRHG